MNEKKLVDSVVSLNGNQIIQMADEALYVLSDIYNLNINEQISKIQSSFKNRFVEWVRGKEVPRAQLELQAKLNIPVEVNDALKFMRIKINLLRDVGLNTSQINLSLEDFQILQRTKDFYTIKFDELVEKRRLEDRDDMYRKSQSSFNHCCKKTSCHC